MDQTLMASMINGASNVLGSAMSPVPSGPSLAGLGGFDVDSSGWNVAFGGSVEQGYDKAEERATSSAAGLDRQLQIFVLIVGAVVVMKVLKK